MMHRVPFVFLGAPEQQREICDPKKIPVRAGRAVSRGALQIQDLGHAQTNSTKDFTGDLPFIGAEQEQIAFFNLQFGF